MTPAGALLFYSPIDRHDLWTDHLKALLPQLDVRVAPEGLARPDEIAYALVWKPSPGDLARLPRLACVFSLGAGVDHVIADPSYPKSVPLVRVVDPSLTAGMTEYVVLHVLMHHRRQSDFADLQRMRKWRQLSVPAARDVRVGILGLGVLGLDAARRLLGFGYQVSGWSQSRKHQPGIESFAGASELAPFLQRTDILVCLLPLTPETRGILNARTFAQLPRGAVVINAARGGHLVESDLLAALDAGQIKAATLDVFACEPLPSSSPLWAHPKVTVTPHVASITDPRFVARAVVDNIKRLEAGEALENVVDLSRGY